MYSKRTSSRFAGAATVAGLRSVQTLTSLAVPSYGRSAQLLQHVPEHGEMDLGPTSTKVSTRQIFRSEDWDSLQEAVKGLFEGKNPVAIPGELARLHQNVKNILASKTGTFLSDYYKQELLAKGMSILVNKLKNLERQCLLQRMEEIWKTFFTEALPTLEALLYLVKPKSPLTIRRTTLAAYRDIVFFGVDIEGAIQHAITSKQEISDGIQHMLLILQNVNDCYPPNENKKRLEAVVGRVIVPYLGFFGLYNGGTQPVVESNEPMLASRRRSSVDFVGNRRISRPFTIQPFDMDTLNQMFINAVRNRTDV